MLGFEDKWVGICYILCPLSALICVVYGIINWNKGDTAVEKDDIEWAKHETEIAKEEV